MPLPINTWLLMSSKTLLACRLVRLGATDTLARARARFETFAQNAGREAMAAGIGCDPWSVSVSGSAQTWRIANGGYVIAVAVHVCGRDACARLQRRGLAPVERAYLRAARAAIAY